MFAIARMSFYHAVADIEIYIYVLVYRCWGKGEREIFIPLISMVATSNEELASYNVIEA